MGDVLGGALGAGAAELGRPLAVDESKLIQELVSLGLGAVGGGSGAATGLAGERYTRKVLIGDEEGAAQDVMTAFLLSRLGVAGGQIIAKLKGPAKEVASQMVDDLAEDAFRKAQGSYTADGKPLMDFRDLSSDQKRIVGEVLGPDAVKGIVPDGRQIARPQGTGTNGIDELYAVNREDVDYIHVEYKFVTDPNKYGTDRLGKTSDGLQGSETWIAGSRRLENALGEQVAGNVRYAMEKGRLESLVVTVRPDGSTQIQVLDAAGNVKPISKSRIIDKISGGRP